MPREIEGEVLDNKTKGWTSMVAGTAPAHSGDQWLYRNEISDLTFTQQGICILVV
jgi:hypothetical protein